MPPSIAISTSSAHDDHARRKASPNRKQDPILASSKKKQIGNHSKAGKKPDVRRINRENALSTEHQSISDDREATALLDGPSQGTNAGAATNTALSQYSTNNPILGTPYGGMYGGLYGNSMYGMGMMSPMMFGGPFSGLYQVLFGVQNVIFSLGQAVQILGMNQQALQQALDSVSTMADHAIATFYELRALEAVEQKHETEDQKKRRRRLKAMRWALLMGTSWFAYKLFKYLTTSRRRRLRHQTNHGGIRGGGASHSIAPPQSPFIPNNYYGTGGFQTSPVYGQSMYGGSYTSSPFGMAGYGIYQ